MPAAGTVFLPESFVSFIRSRAVVPVAVSGGGDSMALLSLVADLVRGSMASALVLTVDHGLRSGSADEAAMVAALCQGRGIAHRTLRWAGKKPSSGLPAAARLARHRLLADAAHAAGADFVVTGHTRDDQAETVIMRQARGEGVGLAGIAPATLFEQRVWFLRPLLDVSRDSLRSYLIEQGIDWVEDPTNEDERYERARTRRMVREDVDAAGRIDAALEAAAAARRERLDLNNAAADLIRAYASLSGNVLTIGRKMFGGADCRATVHALRILLACVGGLDHLPDAPRVEALAERLASGWIGRASLARSVVAAKREQIVITRELRRGAAVTDVVAAALRSPWTTFLPSFDLEPARALAELIGIDAQAALPWP